MNDVQHVDFAVKALNTRDVVYSFIVLCYCIQMRMLMLFNFMMMSRCGVCCVSSAFFHAVVLVRASTEMPHAWVIISFQQPTIQHI